jgi:hypothetical protein
MLACACSERQPNRLDLTAADRGRSIRHGESGPSQFDRFEIAASLI